MVKTEIIKRVFLDWNDLLVVKAAERLLAEKPLLSRTWVVVPTAGSAQRLTAEMARQYEILFPHAEEKLELPRFYTAESLAYSCVRGGEETRDRWMQMLAWAEVLKTIDFREYPALFRSPAGERSYAWASGLAEQFVRVKQVLAEGNLGMEDVYERLMNKGDCRGVFIPESETDRWRDMVRLENKAAEVLEGWGGCDPDTEVRKAVQNSSAPRYARRVILLGHPDPLALSLTALESWREQGILVETWIHAPQSYESCFDQWGRPIAEKWQKEDIDLPLNDGGLSVEEESESLGLAVSHCLTNWAALPGSVVLGVCDPDFTPAVEGAVEDAGWKVYRAEGYGLMSGGWNRLWQSVRLALETPDALPPVEKLSRLRLVQTALKWNLGFQMACHMDEIRSRHLPETVSFAETFLTPEEKEEWSRLTAWLSGWKPGNIGHEMLHFVEEWLSVVTAPWRAEEEVTDDTSPSENPAEIPMENPMDTPLEIPSDVAEDIALAELVKKGAELVASLEEAGVVRSAEAAFLLMERYLEKNRTYADRSTSNVDLVNWLELSFTPEPYLALAALHEGAVPKVHGGDPFLPEKFRRFLGLGGNEERVARDAFLLKSLMQSREKAGSVGIFLSRFSPSGQSCNPSSLLMRCPEDELPERVKVLFPQETGTRVLPAPSRGSWVLSSEEESNRWSNPHKGFSPSVLNSFLQCPFRFRLKNMYGFERLELSSSVPARELGNVIHESMEELGKGDWRDCTDGARLAVALKEVFSEEFTKRFGSSLSLPLTIQYEMGLKRMESAAYAQAAAVREGWHILSTEHVVSNWPLAQGCLLNMRIDCLQEHEDGQIRILDYKTGRKATPPHEAHWKKLSARTHVLLEQYLPGLLPFEAEVGGKKANMYRWSNLQLPLYALWAASHYPGREVSTGYFNIPLNLDSVGINQWLDLDASLLESAREWALCIMKMIREGDWSAFPSAERLGWPVYPNDDFLKLGDDGLERAFGLTAANNQQMNRETE